MKEAQLNGAYEHWNKLPFRHCNMLKPSIFQASMCGASEARQNWRGDIAIRYQDDEIEVLENSVGQEAPNIQDMEIFAVCDEVQRHRPETKRMTRREYQEVYIPALLKAKNRAW